MKRKNCMLGIGISPRRLPALRRALLAWYDAHGRVLPWRQTSDPYKIWVSEVMLQQTRVAAATEYYQRFTARFATVRALARASEADVLAQWSGLGYYRRARMLHAAAKLVVEEYSGEVPTSEAALRHLPGIGRYTAAAIASIAFGEATAVVDSNVERVSSRMRGAPPNSKDEYWQQASEWLDRKRPGDWNQAMMELGATICLPGKPKCGVCPARRWCVTQGQLPAEKRADSRHKHTVTYLLASKNTKGSKALLLVQRGEEERLMAGMWELPTAESAEADAASVPLLQLKHSITVTDYEVRVIAGTRSRGQGSWVSVRELQSLPFTGLARKILRRLGVLTAY